MSNVRRSRVWVVVALAAALVVWQCRGDDDGGDDPADEAAEHAARGGGLGMHGRDPGTGAPRWFGQLGARGRHVAGVVIGEDGAPVPGAAVRLASALTRAGLIPEPGVVTDAAGRFDFGPQPAAAHVVVAMKPGLTGAFERIDLRDPTASPPADDLRLVLHACTAAIHGTIRDSAGGVIAGALVAPSDYRLATRAGAQSDAGGAYELCVPPGGASVAVAAEGYATIVDQVVAYGRTRRDFELAPGTSVIGRVVRADDRSPVAGAIVELRPGGSRGSRVYLAAASDDQGRFEIAGVAPGRHELRARAEGLASPRAVTAIAEVGRSAEVVCEVMAALEVSGKVVEQEGGAPVPGVTVQLMGAGKARGLDAITQPDGRFAIAGVVPGEYTAFVTNYLGAARAAVTVEATDVSDVVIEVERRATISGRVLHDGKPVDGARVRAGETYVWATTDHAGRYTLRGVEPGTHELYADSQRVGAFGRGPTVTVAAGDHRTDADVELDLSASIAGVVVDQHGAPVAGAYLSFSLLGGRDFGMATTADDGSFTARALAGGGEYAFEVRQRDGSPIVYPPLAGKRHPPITVRDGRSHVTGLRVAVRIERLAIAGRVTDAAGAPVPDVVVRAEAGGRGGYRTPSATSDETGAFAIRDLAPGTYTLRASAAHGHATVEDVAAGRTGVEIRLAAAGGIEGTLEGFTGTPEVFVMGREVPFRAAVVEGTRFHARDLPSGSYQVAAKSGAEGASARVTVPPGGIARVVLRLPEIGRIEGVALDEETRAPLAGLRCVARSTDRSLGWSGPPQEPAVTDARGAFRIERAAAGPNTVLCRGEGVRALGEVTVHAGQTARIELANRSRSESRRGDAGLTLEEQLGEIRVKTVVPGGPAARAGIAVGDVLVTLDGRKLAGMDAHIVQVMLQLHTDRPAKLELERGSTKLTVELTAEPAPP